jgi:hypothetical protein
LRRFAPDRDRREEWPIARNSRFYFLTPKAYLLSLTLQVIHVILSAEAGAAEIPLLLAGQSLPASDNVGTQNYSKKPVAVVTGGGYYDERFKLMKDACEGKGGVSWLRPDMGYPMPPLGPQYGAIMVERVKKEIKELVDSGKLGGEGVFIY